MTEPFKISASQIEKFILCPRRWAFEKIEGRSDPAGEAADVGNKIHELLENYLGKGIPIDPQAKYTGKSGAVYEIGKIALSGVKHLPKPFEGLVEEWFKFECSVPGGRVIFHGRIDWHKIGGGKAHVLDHKSVSKLKGAKTEDQLKENPQSVLYSVAMITKGAQVVDLSWIYYEVNPPGKSKPVRLQVLNGDKRNEAAFGRLREIAGLMLYTKNTFRAANDVPPNTDGCFAFNKLCTFAGRCNKPTQGIGFMQDPFKLIQQHQEAQPMQQQQYAVPQGGQNPFAAPQAQQYQPQQQAPQGPPPGMPAYVPGPQVQQAPQQVMQAPQQFQQQPVQQYPQGFVSGPPHQGINPPEQPSHAQITEHQNQHNQNANTPAPAPAEKGKRATRKENGVATNPTPAGETSESMSARMQIATALYAASISRGETDVDEEMGLARRAVSRANALLQALAT